MDRKDRLKMAFEYARSKGFVHTQKDLASLINASEGNISKALKGDPKVLTDRFLRRFNEAFSNIFSLDWLCLGEGEMIVGDEEAIIKERNKMLADNVEFAIATRNDSEVGEKLRLYFNRQGISQVDIAEKLGVSKAYVNALFNGNSTFGKKTAEKWEAEFGISKSFLLTGNGQMLVGGPPPIGVGTGQTQNNGNSNTTNNALNNTTTNLNNDVMETSVKQRLIGFIKHENLSQKKFETLVGLSNGYVNNIRQSISPEKLQSIALCFPNLSLEWLLTGEGEMLRGGVGMVNVSCGHGNASVRENNGSFTINNGGAGEGSRPRISYSEGSPYYNVDFEAGFDILYNDQSPAPEYNIYIPQYNGRGIIWCNITGDSMSPTITSGDIIAIKEVYDWQSYIVYGEIYAIVTSNDMRTVKIIRKGSTDEKVRLVPINHDEFDEQEIPISLIMKVFKVVGCIKRL